jgi:hypothetical protein
MTTRAHSAALLLLAISAGPALAQSEAIDLGADRPDFTESALTVPRGSLQIEAGTTWERSDGGFDALSGPETLLRWGVADRLELRLELPEWVDSAEHLGGGGLSDAAVGAKLRIGPLGAWDVAAIGMLTLPTGDDDLTSDEADPALALVASRDVAEGWSVAAQIVAAWPTTDGERDLETVLTVVAGVDLGERTGAFLEVAATNPAAGGSEVLLHSGCTFQAGRAWQVDVHVGGGLTESAPDFLVGAGLAARF